MQEKDYSVGGLECHVCTSIVEPENVCSMNGRYFLIGQTRRYTVSHTTHAFNKDRVQLHAYMYVYSTGE